MIFYGLKMKSNKYILKANQFTDELPPLDKTVYLSGLDCLVYTRDDKIYSMDLTVYRHEEGPTFSPLNTSLN